MNILKTRLPTVDIAGALICMASSLLAQDLPGQWYLGFDAGLALQEDMTVQNSGGDKLSFDPGFRLDLGGGIHLSESWKAELQMGFIYNAVRSGGETLEFPSWFGGGTWRGSLDYVQVPIMGNVIYTLPLGGPFNAYAGAGIGGVYGQLWNSIFSSEDSFNFGYQGIVGVKYALNDQLDLGVMYKYLGTTEQDFGAARLDGTRSHSILAALTLKF